MTDCPHPEKIAHRSCGAALRARESLDDPSDLALRPYRCVCGAWHLGHRGKNLPLKIQIEKALRAGRKNARQSRRKRSR